MPAAWLGSTFEEWLMAAGACGLIVEVHPDPDKAMSDGAQSLDFAMFADLCSRMGKSGKTEKTGRMGRRGKVAISGVKSE
jgi:3-deoxy-D-arabino-heptulosonate 7-phosphate (DAHP) synthase